MAAAARRALPKLSLPEQMSLVLLQALLVRLLAPQLVPPYLWASLMAASQRQAH